MKRKFFFRALTLALTLSISGSLKVSAQDDELQSPFTPSLGLAVPLKQSGERVLVAQKFLLNPGVIINAGDQIRVIFPRPEISDKDVRMKNARKNLEATFSRQPGKIQGQDDTNTESAIYRAALDRATKNVWRDEMRFRAYLDRMDLDGNILVFQQPGAETLTVDLFAFPQDLFLGENGGKITVLAVRKNSTLHKLGVSTGAVLTGINGQPLAGLEAFRQNYFQAEQSAREQNQPLKLSFVFPGETAPRELVCKSARSLSGNLLLMDLPDVTTPPQPSGTAPANAP